MVLQEDLVASFVRIEIIVFDNKTIICFSVVFIIVVKTRKHGTDYF